MRLRKAAQWHNAMELRHAMVVKPPAIEGPSLLRGRPPPAATVRVRGGPSCYEVADDHCVVAWQTTTENDGGSLELHVVVDADSDATLAWWELEDTMWTAEPGVA